MLVDKTSSNSLYKIQSGQTYSNEKVWFINDSLKQTIVMELYTDYHRVITFHFYNKDIPTDLINNMTLHKSSELVANLVQKLNDIDGFIQQATRIKAAYFTTYKGFRLGDTKQQSLDVYGKPNKQSIHLGVEKLEWEFIGDQIFENKTDLKGKPLAKNSYGHRITMYFKNSKLIGQILYNDIP